MSAAWEAYQRVQMLLRLAEEALPAERAACLELAALALDDPMLASWRGNPLARHGGEFLSLDAQAEALALARGGGTSGEEAVIGGLWSAVYRPAEGRATPCRLWAVADWKTPPRWRWEPPCPVHDVSDALTAAAATALNAALEVLDAAREPLLTRPVQLYFAVVGASQVQGDSLTLPLCLALLSALARLALPAGVGATGALDGTSVRAVGWTAAKTAALAAQGVRLLCPEGGTRLATLAARTLLGGACLLPERKPRRAALPATATPTFLVADVELDPWLWGSHPGAVRAALRRIEVCVKRLVRRQEGELFRGGAGRDEGLYAAFRSGEAACTAAIALQRALLSQPFPAPIPEIRLRIGLHQGPADRHRGSYSSPATRLAYHLMGIATPGQILLSATVARQVSASTLEPLGLYRLDALGVVVPLYCLLYDAMPLLEAPRAPQVAPELARTQAADPRLAALAEAMGLVTVETEETKRANVSDHVDSNRVISETIAF